MSNHDQYPSSNDDSGVREQIPHSGIHHDETPVRDFDKTPLTEAVEQGLIETPDSPAALLEPTTEKPRSRWSVGQKIGAAAATVVVGAGALIGAKAFGGDSTPAPERNPAASATPTPGATETAKPAEQLSPGEAIGTRQTDFENLNVVPDQAVVDRAKQITPTSMSSYDALIDLSRKENVYDLSGKVQDIQGSEVILTPESEKDGNEILANLLGSNITDLARENSLGVRKGVALRTNFFGEGKLLNVENEKNEYATFNITLTDVVLLSETDTSATYNATRNISTNYEALDRGDVFNNPNFGTSEQVPIVVTIVQEDGKWVIDSLEKR